MKRTIDILTFFALLQVLFIIYGVCGAYEQGMITGIEFFIYLVQFSAALGATIGGIKMLKVMSNQKNREFLKKLITTHKRFNHSNDTIQPQKCQPHKTHRNAKYGAFDFRG